VPQEYKKGIRIKAKANEKVMKIDEYCARPGLQTAHQTLSHYQTSTIFFITATSKNCKLAFDVMSYPQWRNFEIKVTSKN
jgi:hypothetical protein